MSRLEPPASPTGLSPTRASKRHQIKRSLSELASPTRSRNQQRKEQQPDDKHLYHVHSTPMTRRSLDAARFDAGNMAQSPEESRRGSDQPPQDDTAEQTAQRERRNDALRNEKARMAESSENIRRSLVELNSFSANASHRLDEAYYAVLEKMSTLQGTIMMLKDLAETSQEICNKFDKESRGLENDVATQLGGFGQFQGQHTQITALQKRVDKSRGKMESLGSRLQAVQTRVERWEQADRQWQEKTRRRLKIIWSVMSAVVIVLIVLIWGVSQAADQTNNAPESLATPLSILDPLNKSNFAQPPGRSDEPLNRKLEWKTTQRNEDSLHALDEL